MTRYYVTKNIQGFTLLEMMMVITIFGILLSLALPTYQKSAIRAREAVLKEDLFLMRDIIDKYRVDKGHYPESLEALVEEEYIRAVPIDPFVGTSEAWVEEYSFDEDEEVTGIYDIHSGSDLVGTNGTSYSEW